MRPLKEYAHEKLLLDLAAAGIQPPAPSSSPFTLRFQEAINQWFSKCDTRRNADRARDQELHAAYRVRRMAVNAENRRKRDAEAKRESRAARARAEGRALRTRANLAAMSNEEKMEHHRQKEREKKRRQRIKKRYETDWQV